MRILWLARRDFTDRRGGGAERTIEEVCTRLAKYGHEVTIVSGTPYSRTTNLTGNLRLVQLGSFALAHAVAPALVHRTAPDEVVVDDLAHALPWFSPWFSNSSVVPFFHHLHARTAPGQLPPGLAAIPKLAEVAYPRVYSGSQWVTESMASFRDLTRLGVPPSSVHRIPPGVDSVLFQPREKTREPTIVYFAGMRAYKRPDHALLALSQLHRRGVSASLRMVGDGPVLDKLVLLASRLNLERFVEFEGRVSVQELSKIVSESWVSVYCSVSEGWGFSVMEAAACGIPTVAYTIPALEESIVQGQTGFLVEDGNVNALADGLADAISTMSRWVQPCREWAAKWTWERAARNWEEHLLGVLDEL